MTKEPKPLPNLDAVANLMTRVGLFDEQIVGKRDEDYFSSIGPVALGLFRLVVIGEIKKGKSSFINALCGIPGLVPVHDDVATSTVFKIHHAPEPGYTVFFQPEAEDKTSEIGTQKLEISEADLHSYGTENGNPDNEKRVDFIAVCAPSPILKDGLIVVDTPGVGGLFKKHREITFRHAPRADAVFFITDSVESPIGAAEVDFLKELRRITPLIYFVQTKAAQVDAEARRKRMENNIGILTDKVGLKKEEIRYFVVDSKLKSEGDEDRNLEDLEDSGFPPLMSYLQHSLKASKDRNIATVGLRRAWSKIAEIRAEIDRQKSVVSADTAEKQSAFNAELATTEEKLKQWNSEIRIQLIKEFHTEAQAIQNDILGEVSEALRVGGRISEQVGEALSESRDLKPEEIYGLVEPLSAAARAEVSQVLLECSQKLEGRFSALLGALSVKAEGSIATTALSRGVINNATLIRFSDAQLRDLAAKAEESRLFDRARTGLYGGAAGVGIAMGIGAVVGSVIPVVGTILGSTAGMVIAGLWGGYQASEFSRVKESAVARQQVQAAIDRDLQGCLTQAQTGFQKAFNTLRSRAEEALSDMVKTSLDQLSNTRQELQQRSRATAEEVQRTKQQIHGREQMLAALQGEMEAMERLLG
ncbi:MAG: dynamin family protein [Verrucomicrobiae bacterium]|nr:dynamin family protein [Verrucomicrobiae bacterium]